MRVLIRAGPLRLAAGVVATTLALAGAQSAEAQSVYFSGYTQGCFGSSCTPTSPTATLGGLTYTASTGFAGTTSNGFLAIGGGSNNFGTFSLAASNFNYFGHSFTLLITFIDPSSNQNQFTAALLGSVSQNATGGVTVFFDPTQVQTWRDANGTYSVRVNPTSVFPGQTVPVTGDLTAAV